MKPNELRIGCYVKLRDSGEIVRVERITRRKVGFFHNNDKSRGYFRKYSEIEPVLIRDVYDSLPHIPDLMWSNNTNSGLCYYKDLVLIYLHELQNAYFVLMGEELKIDL